MEREDFLNSVEEKDERLEALKQLYPEIFSDGKINLDAFKDATGTSDLPEGEDKTPGYYGLYWPGKRAAKQLAKKPATGTLEPVPGDGVNEDTTHNIYIEGDNLEVLRTLRSSYRGRVKMIYIDPPYNTGHDFIYKDDFKDVFTEYYKYTGQIDEKGNSLVSNKKSDGAYHRKWLDMMCPRLYLANDFLHDEGVIFISINDAEVGSLKLLCNEIFGEENFLACLVWDKNHSAQAGIFKVYHEYVLVYAKNIESFGVPNSLNDDLFEAGAMKKESGRHKAQPFTFPKGTRFDAKNGVELKGEWGGLEKVKLLSGRMVSDNGYLSEDVTLEAAWTQVNQMKEFFYGDKDALVDSKGQKIVEFYLTGAGKVKVVKKRSAEAMQTTMRYSTQGVISKDLADLFKTEDSPFDSPKPVQMIKDFIHRFTESSDIIMDFFSGSATTAQAVLEFYKGEEEQRKFILIQIPENLDKALAVAQKDAVKTLETAIRYLDKIEKPHTICEIGKERIRLVGRENKNIIDNGFKVYRLIESNVNVNLPDVSPKENFCYNNSRSNHV